jgi:hypothetical protein
MFSLRSNALITRFPTTPQQISSIGARDLNRILNELELGTEGALSAKKRETSSIYWLKSTACLDDLHLTIFFH